MGKTTYKSLNHRNSEFHWGATERVMYLRKVLKKVLDSDLNTFSSLQRSVEDLRKCSPLKPEELAKPSLPPKDLGARDYFKS